MFFSLIISRFRKRPSFRMDSGPPTSVFINKPIPLHGTVAPINSIRMTTGSHRLKLRDAWFDQPT